MFAESLPVVDIAEFSDNSVNSSGIFDKIKLLPIELVYDFVPPAGFDGQAALGAVELVVDAEWTDIEITHRSGSWVQSVDYMANGTFWKQSLSFTIAKDRPDLVAWFNRHARRQWIAAIQDRNEYWRVIGTPSQPLLIESASASTGRNARSVMFAAETEQEAFFLHEDEFTG